MEVIPPEVCSWFCTSVIGQIAVLMTIIMTFWQEIRHHKNKNKVKVVKSK